MTKNIIIKTVLFMLSLVLGAAGFAAGELAPDDFSARPLKTGIPGVWELYVTNDSNRNAEVKVVCGFGPRGLDDRISVVVPANCTARPFIYDEGYIRELTLKPERPQCRIVSVAESSKRTPACPDS